MKPTGRYPQSHQQKCHAHQQAATQGVLFQIFLKKRFQPFKRNDVHLIVEIGVVCAGDNEQLLVVPGQLVVRRFAEIARVCLSAMHQQHSRSDLAAALQDRHIQERK